MATGDRVLVGKKGSDYGVWVVPSGGDVLADDDKNMLLSSDILSMGQLLLFQAISTSSNSTTTQNYNNRGAGKTFFFWWYGSAVNYSAGTQFLALGDNDLEVRNKYINATTNQIKVINRTASTLSIIALVVNQAAA